MKKLIQKKNGKYFIIYKFFFLYFVFFNYKILIYNINKLIKGTYFIEENNEFFKNFTQLKSISLNENSYLMTKEKKNFLKLILKDINKNISLVNNIFFIANCRFGNCIALLNKYIHFCEIIKCKTIILDEKYFWFLKSNIKIRKNNIDFILTKKENFNESSTIKYNSLILFYIFFHIKPEIKSHLLKY